jgi:hypothetical protein
MVFIGVSGNWELGDRDSEMHLRDTSHQMGFFFFTICMPGRRFYICENSIGRFSTLLRKRIEGVFDSSAGVCV